MNERESEHMLFLCLYVTPVRSLRFVHDNSMKNITITVSQTRRNHLRKLKNLFAAFCQEFGMHDQVQWPHFEVFILNFLEAIEVV